MIADVGGYFVAWYMLAFIPMTLLTYGNLKYEVISQTFKRSPVVHYNKPYSFSRI